MLKNPYGDPGTIAFGEGFAFVSLILSVSAMDSESIILPTIISLTSAFALLRSAIKREKENPHTDR